MGKFLQWAQIHKYVIHFPHQLGHNGKCEGKAQEWPLKDIRGTLDAKCLVCQEERIVKKLHGSVLELVCKECFNKPE